MELIKQLAESASNVAQAEHHVMQSVAALHDGKGGQSVVADAVKELAKLTGDVKANTYLDYVNRQYDEKANRKPTLAENMQLSRKRKNLEQNLYAAIEYQNDGPSELKKFEAALDALKSEVGESEARAILTALKKHHKAQNNNNTGVVESMKFKLDIPKHEPAKTNYPKTNLKRQMDDYNEKLGGWATTNTHAGHHLTKRDGGDKLVIDSIGEDGLVSTAVVSNNGELHKDMTIDFYNHSLGSKNEYSNPEKAGSPWKFKAMSMDDLNHSDQRNMPTSKTADVKTRGRQKDGNSLQALANSSRKD